MSIYQSLRWSIGGKTIGVIVECDHIPPSWKALFPDFVLKDKPSTVNDIELLLTPMAAHGSKPLNTLPKTAIFCDSDELRISNFDIEGSLKRAPSGYAGSFEVEASRGDTLASVIRMCLGHTLLDDRCFLLHASGVIHGDRVWLFSGPAGSGKTTIARELNNGGLLFAVDTVAIVPSSKGILCALPTPFSDTKTEVKNRSDMEIAGIAFIEQASEHRLQRLDLIKATKQLLVFSVAAHREGRAEQNRLDAAVSIASQVDCFSLRFSRDPLFWSLLHSAYNR